VSAVKQRYIEGGRVRSAPSIDRGELLVYTEEEWRERLSTVQRRMYRTLLVLLSVVYFALIIPIVVATAGIEDVPIELPIFLLIMMSIVVWVPGILALMMNRYQSSLMPAVGLYEGGVQLGPGLFVPYGEIERVESVDRVPGGGRWGGRAVKLHPRFKRRPFPGVEVPGYWFLKVEFLGDEGVAELERGVSGLGEGVQKPPKLVLYGRRGAGG
jgi:hypothetical protein